MKSYISVEEIMSRKHFEHTEVIAGESGLTRHLKWVHIVESPQVNHLLKGNELVLSTGIGWKDKPEHLLHFVQQLIDCNAAGLCIEMKTYITHIPQDVITLANTHQFPIIIFHKEVLFVEITHDIHSLIINKQYQLLTDLEQFSQKLNKMMLEVDQHEQFLTLLNSYLDVQVITKFNCGKIECFPNLSTQQREKLLNDGDKPKISKNIQILGDIYAELVIISKSRELNDFDALILDRTATILGQFWLRDLYVSEKRMDKEHEWLTSWLNADIKSEVLLNHLSSHHLSTGFSGGIVWACHVKELLERSPNKEFTYFKLITRTVFEQFGFHLFYVESESHLIIIALDKRKNDNWKERMTKAFHSIHHHDSHSRKSYSELSIGAGQYVKNIMKINKSYQAALNTLELQEYVEKEKKSYFYEDLHMFRMLTLLKEQGNLEETVYEYLEPVIEYDKSYNGELLTTLKTYLACNASKQETSKKLFIVRQTLYHRIEKLETILGGDFMQSGKRLELEFMLVAYDYLTKYKQEIFLKAQSR